VSRRSSPQPFTLGTEFSLEQPLDYEDARSAAHTFAVQRQEARQQLEAAYAESAQAEYDYRKARRRERAKAEGETGKERDEFVDSATAGERLERDRAQFKVKVIGERLEEIDATRASFHKLVEWSAKVDPAAAEERSGNGDVEQLRRSAA
jgi:hypothetical protein